MTFYVQIINTFRSSVNASGYKGSVSRKLSVIKTISTMDFRHRTEAEEVKGRSRSREGMEVTQQLIPLDVARNRRNRRSGTLRRLVADPFEGQHHASLTLLTSLLGEVLHNSFSSK